MLKSTTNTTNNFIVFIIAFFSKTKTNPRLIFCDYNTLAIVSISQTISPLGAWIEKNNMKAALRKDGINGTPLLNTSTFAPLSSMNQVLYKNALPTLENIDAQDVFDVVIADPPYNIGKDFGNNSDHRTINEYILWCDKWIGECLRLAKPSAPVYIYGFAEVLAHIAVRYPLEKQSGWCGTIPTKPCQR